MHVVLLYHQAVREWYHSNKYQEDRQNQMLEFEKKKIVLDLPAGSCEPKVVDGWKILPMTYPQVKLYFTSTYEIFHYACLYRLTNVILSDISVVKMLLDAPSS